MKRRPWTAVEKEVVHRVYAVGGMAAVLAEIPHRTETEVRCYAKRNGLQRRARPITADVFPEVARLYREGGAPAVRELLPRMSAAAVGQWARRNGISRDSSDFRPLKRSFGEIRPSACLRKWRGPVMAGPLVATIGGGI